MRTAVIVLCFALLGAPVLQAVETPVTPGTPISLKERADQNVSQAQQLMRHAQEILDARAHRNFVTEAAQTYVRAGQLLEQSGKIYQALGPQHISQADLQQTSEAMKFCIEAAQNLSQSQG